MATRSSQFPLLAALTGVENAVLPALAPKWRPTFPANVARASPSKIGGPWLMGILQVAARAENEAPNAEVTKAQESTVEVELPK